MINPYGNYTLSELERMARHTDNHLALAILERTMMAPGYEKLDDCEAMRGGRHTQYCKTTRERMNGR